jgi:hypothetical protein
LTSAEKCRVNGWQVGDVLEGTERTGDWWGTERIVLTAIGKHSILACSVARATRDRHEMTPVRGREEDWTLAYRDWRKVETTD